MFRSRDKARHTLGVAGTPTGLRGALVRHTADERTILRLFGGVTQTGDASAMLEEPALASIGDGMASSYGGDGTGGAVDVFLSSEFGQIQVPLSMETEPVGATLMVDDLKKMLAGCRDLGLVDVDVVWSLGTPHFSWTEDQDKDSSADSRSVRFKVTDGQDAKRHEGEQSVVLKMASGRGNALRQLTAKPRSDEPSSAAIKSIRGTQDSLVRRCVTDSEISSLLALVLTGMDKDDNAVGEPTLVVRIGEDDVLVLVVEDGLLKQVDVLRSLSVHDGADMICSRVLLLQDEHGLDGLARIYLAGTNDSVLLSSFGTYFQQAEVLSLSSEIGRMSPSGSVVDAEVLPAIGAAFREVLDFTEDDNMLPQPLRQPRRTIPYSWEVWTLLICLSLTALFFVGRFASQERVITSRYDRIEALTHDVQTASLLQQRIDSLQVAYSVNMKGLDVLDSLLIGSDKWSRTFDKLAQELSDIEGIWIEKWQPAGPVVAITGRATSRDRVVDLAHRLHGTMEEIIYPNEEEAFYFFRMKAPIIDTLPQAAQYLRDHAAEDQRQPDARKLVAFTLHADDAAVAKSPTATPIL